jgi:protein TonB
VGTRNTYFEFEVEKQVETAKGSPQPRYPAGLRESHTSGEVLAQFVVDSTGRAEMATFRVLRSTHEGFTQAVRDAVRNMRFYPAEIGGRKVKQMVQQPFTFAIAEPDISEEHPLPSLFPARPRPNPWP